MISPPQPIPDETVHANFAAETGPRIRSLSPQRPGLCARIAVWKGAELRHFLLNNNRDLSLELWVEEQLGIEPINMLLHIPRRNPRKTANFSAKNEAQNVQTHIRA